MVSRVDTVLNIRKVLSIEIDYFWLKLIKIDNHKNIDNRFWYISDIIRLINIDYDRLQSIFIKYRNYLFVTSCLKHVRSLLGHVLAPWGVWMQLWFLCNSTTTHDMTLFLFFQFIKPPPKVPWKALLLAFFLFTVGTLLLIFGSLLFTGYFDVKVRRFCQVCEIFLIFLHVSIFLSNDCP